MLNTAHSGFVAYDLPGTANARILWGTGRGSYQRTGAILQGDLEASAKQASDPAPAPGDTISYTILLQNPGPALETATMTDTLPSGVSFVGNLIASSGTTTESGGVITWQGAVSAANPVTIQFDAVVSAAISGPQAIINTVLIDDGEGNVIQREAMIVVNGYTVYLPLVARE